MNREQIVKALECCDEGTSEACLKCPIRLIPYPSCKCVMEKHAIALIRELTEDNEQKDETIAGLIGTIKDAYGFAVRKMQEMLKGRAYYPRPYSMARVVDECDIDQIAKEMLKEG